MVMGLVRCCLAEGMNLPSQQIEGICDKEESIADFSVLWRGNYYIWEVIQHPILYFQLYVRIAFFKQFQAILNTPSLCSVKLR